MTTQQSTVDYIVDQLSQLHDIATRRMFGEYALYTSGKVVGLVCNDVLFIKITEQGKDFAGDLFQEGIPFPGAKSWFKIESDLLENHEWLCELVAITAEFAPETKKKKKRG